MESLNEKFIKAERGDMNSALEIANEILWGDDEPIEESILRRIKDYLADAVEQGSGIAMRMVGDMYYKARGVERDLDKAAFWYDKAAELGVGDAAEMLKKVKPQKVDYEKLFKDYAKAAMDGDPIGYLRIGEMYEEGNFVPQSDKEAFNCFVLAQQMACKDKYVECYPDICMKLGEYFYTGKGTESSASAAMKFFEEANDYYRIQFNKGDDSKKELMMRSEDALEEVKAVMVSGCNGVI